MIKVGVVGVGRGRTFINSAKDTGMELVALCDIWEEKLNEIGKQYNVATYTDFDKFLEHDMDAVILANYFHRHAPFAIKALDAGLHVMSETTAVITMAEGVALINKVEETGKVYMLAENYPYFRYNQEMRRLYQEGEIGEMVYGEGEYIHPDSVEARNKRAPGFNHWRNLLPATYYNTHALAPIMYITDTIPVTVNALCIPFFDSDEQSSLLPKKSDMSSVILTRMNNESVVRTIGVNLRGHGNWYRIHGTRGLMENLRTFDQQMLRVKHDAFELREGETEEKIYKPEFPVLANIAKTTGHGGGDFFTDYHFAEAIRTGKTPYFDVYRAVAMSAVAIQGYKSAHEHGVPYEIPDFKNSLSAREKYKNDNWCPMPEFRDLQPNQPYPSVYGDRPITEEAKALARKHWQEIGYKGEDL
jgi:predicted dehydrogenase